MLKRIRKVAKARLHVPPREFRMILLASVLLMIGAMAFVWPNVRMVKLGYEYQVLVKQQRDLLRENNLLLLEKSSLESLDRVHALAKEKLGLKAPENGQIVTVFLK
ncbi:MAG: cell division protein FtsL [Nitrospinaceae bacterium]|jgi:cell division protein FtsL|nr:MAG: cell division protein FtsL [Nitrospinaceae bacterium]